MSHRTSRSKGRLILALASPSMVVSACVLLLSLLQTTRAQQDATGTQDDQLDYSYDPLSPVGPSRWSQIPNAADLSPYAAYPTLDLEGNECASTYRPSPLHIRPTPDRPFADCIDRHEMLTRQIDPTLSCTPFDATFSITPHTLKMSFPSSDDPLQNGCFRPRINLSGNFPDEFVFGWLEVHARSDHVVDGKRYDAEIQMVHLGQEEDDYMVATVSVLVDATARRDHAEFQWMLDQWQSVANGMASACREVGGSGGRKQRRTVATSAMMEGREERIERRRRHMEEHGADVIANLTLQSEEDYARAYFGRVDQNQEQQQQQHRRAQYGEDSCRADPRGHGCPGYGKRRKSFPHTLWPTIYYFGYRGSITAPPCSDIVNWRILDVPLEISKRQYQQLTTLMDSSRDDSCDETNAGGSKLDRHGENYQPLREQGAIDIFHCTPDDFRWWMYLPEDQ